MIAFRTLRTVFLPLLVLALAILFWDLGTRLFEPPAYVLPSPGRVLSAARQHAPQLLQASWRTGSAALFGLVASFVVGLLVSLLFSQSRTLERSLYPYAIFLQTVPIIAIAPLIVTWIGTGFVSVVVVAFVISLFPIITSATTGLVSIEPQLLELFELHRASRWQTLLKLRLPHSVPFLVTGLKTSCGLAVVGCIVGENFVGYDLEHFGLGYLIMQSSNQIKADYLFAAIIASTLLGVVMFTLVSLVGRWLIAWGHFAPLRATSATDPAR
jgi:NitT/TauT family transport system permease protein